MGFFGDFFGGKGARKDIDKGIGAVTDNTGNAVGAIQGGVATARDDLAGFRDPKAWNEWNALSGLDNPEAQAAAWGRYYNNPAEMERLRLQEKQRAWQTNSLGQTGSGPGELALARVKAENSDRYRASFLPFAQMERDSALNSANFAAGGGQAVAGAYGQGSNALASLYGQRSQTHTGPQNAIGALGVASRFMPWNWGNNLGGRAGGDGSGNP